MRLILFVTFAFVAMTVFPQSKSFAAIQSQGDIAELDQLFDEQNSQISKLKDRKDRAEKSSKDALAELEELQTLLKKDKDIQSKLGLSQNPNDDYVKGLVKRIQVATQSHITLKAAADRAGTTYRVASDRLTAQKSAYMARLGKPAPISSKNLAGADIAHTQIEQNNDCRLDTESQRLRLSPNECQNRLRDRFKAFTQTADYTAPGRLIDKRGVLNQLSTSGDSTEASIKISGNFRRSTAAATVKLNEANDDSFRKSFSTWGYSVGLNSKNSGRVFSVSEKTNNRSIGSLDRLDSSVTLEGGLNFAVFPSESKSSFASRAKKMALAARKACVEDQKKAEPSEKSSCESDGLINWIFASKTGRDLTYKHPDHVKAFNEVYFAAKAKNPRWGGGVNLELGVPSYSFHRFDQQSLSDPFDLDATGTVKVINPANLPSTFLNNDPVKSRKLAWSASLFTFFHFPAAETTRFNKGTTLILSGTHQREYSFPTGAEGVTICPQIDPNAVAFSDELCDTVNIAEIDRDQSFIGGVELRQKMRFNRFLPEIGIAPKYTHNFKTDRNGLDIPIYLTADKDGKLQGGIKFGHEWGGLDSQNNQRKSASEVSIFVGTTFSLSGNE